ncbi:MAG: amidohydrolase [Gemmataceae bacterium]
MRNARLRMVFRPLWLGLCLVAADPRIIAEPPTPKERPEKASGRKLLVNEALAPEVENLQTLYKSLHSHPELSLQEEKTAARMAGELKKLGFEVTEKVGGFGVVGVLKNGVGPTIMVRTDLDALPVVEKTGLPYASKERGRDKDGNDVGIMHACGHDMHMTCWVGTARVLTKLKDHWQGTLVFIGQPAEEVGKGARSMLEDGLFKRFPRPDYCLALHCDPVRPHGSIAYTDGMALANVDAVEITVRGKGGHGAWPHMTVDPIVLSARIILDLQTIVSREMNPVDPTVVSVGSIHGGTKSNVIPSEVELKLTVRTTKDDVRKHVLESIERIVKGVAATARAPEPIVKIDLNEFTPALINNSDLTRKTVAMFREALGPDNVFERPLVLGGEDFSRYGREKVPIFLYFLGTVAPERIAQAGKEGGTPLPSLHSDLYYPVPEPCIKTGVLTMSLAVLNLLGK